MGMRNCPVDELACCVPITRRHLGRPLPYLALDASGLDRLPRSEFEGQRAVEPAVRRSRRRIISTTHQLFFAARLRRGGFIWPAASVNSDAPCAGACNSCCLHGKEQPSRQISGPAAGGLMRYALLVTRMKPRYPLCGDAYSNTSVGSE
jgi:hypothetical protein